METQTQTVQMEKVDFFEGLITAPFGAVIIIANKDALPLFGEVFPFDDKEEVEEQ